jgi:hypothetical protein
MREDAALTAVCTRRKNIDWHTVERHTANTRSIA